jgi:uncharacterized oligopeptide transporter (OPT) family protein
MMTGLAMSAFVMFIREDANMTNSLKESWAANIKIGGMVSLAMLGVGWSYSLLSIGSGMLIGLRVCVSMVLGGMLAWVVVPWFLVHYHQVPVALDTIVDEQHPIPKKGILFWVMWPATGMLVAGGLTALALKWRILVKTFTSLRGASVDSTEIPLSWISLGIVLSGAALCIVQSQMLHMPVWMTLVAIVASAPLMLVGLRVLGETSWGPISALSNMMQGVFAIVAPGNIAANMVASGTTGTIATSSEAIMQDYKTGDVIGSTPRAMTIAQLLAVPIGAAAVSWIYPVLIQTYGLAEPIMRDGKMIDPQLSSPISVKWAGFAKILEQGASAIPSSALWAMGIFALLGVIFTILEVNPKNKRWVPSPTGIGIGILVPFAVIFTMLLGAIAGRVWERKHAASSAAYAVPLASGFIAGEALVAVFVPLLDKLIHVAGLR